MGIPYTVVMKGNIPALIATKTITHFATNEVKVLKVLNCVAGETQATFTLSDGSTATIIYSDVTDVRTLNYGVEVFTATGSVHLYWTPTR